MTQSGGRGIPPALFVQQLARSTNLSTTAIGREARRQGLRIGNDLLRASVNFARGRTVTPRQRGAFLNVRLIQSGPSRAEYARAIGDFAVATVGRQRVTVTVEVTADVVFRWERSGSAAGETRSVKETQTFNITGAQLPTFNSRLSDLARTFVPRILQRGENLLQAPVDYGEVIISQGPDIDIVRVATS